MLLVSSVFYGPSWVHIHQFLQQRESNPTLLTLGRTPTVLVPDSGNHRELIGNIFTSSNSSRGKEVHLQGIGFVELENKPKLDAKVLVLPLASIACVIALGVFWVNNQPPKQDIDNAPVAEACFFDLPETDFENWLSESLSAEGELIFGQQIEKSTLLGKLEVVVEETIGSAAKITGTASCADGRQRAINHRVDKSGAGAVLELGK